MAISKLGKGPTARRVTLTSGTTYTVPNNVTFLNVTLYGAGGGSGGANCNTGATDGQAGSSTTFTGATTAIGGNGGEASNQGIGSGNTSRISVAGTANTGQGSIGPIQTLTSAGLTYQAFGGDGQDGQVIVSTLSATPGATIAYTIGAGGTAGAAGSGGAAGKAGGSGKIEVEYWV
jgi:hypothetical protein